MLRTHYFVLTILFVMSFLFPALGQDSRGYDEDINRMMKRMEQYPRSSKYDKEIKEAYDGANQADLDRISALRRSGQPDIWYDVANLYSRLVARQKKVRSLPSARLGKIGFTFADYSSEYEKARYNAGAFLYAHAAKLLENDDLKNAKAAYVDLLRLASLYETYNGMDKLMMRAILLGADNIEFGLYNQTGKDLNYNVVDELSSLVDTYKKAKFTLFPPSPGEKPFDFSLRVRIEDIEVTSDKVKETSYREIRDIYEGDRVVDSIDCEVNVTDQYKAARISGRLEYFDKQLKETVLSIPVSATSTFKNTYAYLQGDPDAASNETRDILAHKKLPYPSDTKILMDAVENFTRQAGQVLLGNGQDGDQ